MMLRRGSVLMCAVAVLIGVALIAEPAQRLDTPSLHLLRGLGFEWWVLGAAFIVHGLLLFTRRPEFGHLLGFVLYGMVAAAAVIESVRHPFVMNNPVLIGAGIVLTVQNLASARLTLLAEGDG